MSWIKVADVSADSIHFDKSTSYMLASIVRGIAKQTLKAAIVFEDPIIFKVPHAYDFPTSTCQVGKLCWHRPDANRSSLHPTCCSGFMVDLALHIEADLNTEIYIYEVEDGNFGGRVNGTWNGLIGDVVQGKADVTFNPLVMSQIRSKVIKFIDPLWANNVVLVTIAQHHLPSLWNTLAYKPLSLNLWLTTFGLMLFMSAILIFLNRITGTLKVYSWKSSITYLAGLLFQRDIGGDNPSGFSSRLVSIIFAIATMVIMTTYTAVLTVGKIQGEHRHTITGFDDPKVSI